MATGACAKFASPAVLPHKNLCSPSSSPGTSRRLHLKSAFSDTSLQNWKQTALFPTSQLSRPDVSSTNPGRRRTGVVAEAATVESVRQSIDIDWDTIGFGIRNTDFMFVATCERGGEWSAGELLPFGNLSISPSAAVLNYGQGIFEGLKAQRTADGRILLFRPTENAKRMTYGAKRMSMPPFPEDLFVAAVKRAVIANERWIPPYGKGSLYIRPLLIGSGAVLGLAPAPNYTFLIYVSPVGAYFKSGQMTPLDLIVEEHFHRAAPGGTGGVKTITNYAPVLGTQLQAKGEGFADVMYLDAVENKYIEEVSSCNVFIVKGNEITTPDLRGTILPGITRKSILELANSRGYKAVERPVSVDELLAADEVFCTGTAVVLSSVGSITYKGKRVTYGDGKVGQVSQELYTLLTDLQSGKRADNMGWTVEVKA